MFCCGNNYVGNNYDNYSSKILVENQTINKKKINSRLYIFPLFFGEFNHETGKF